MKMSMTLKAQKSQSTSSSTHPKISIKCKNQAGRTQNKKNKKNPKTSATTPSVEKSAKELSAK
jgi:hypothetical protein